MLLQPLIGYLGKRGSGLAGQTRADVCCGQSPERGKEQIAREDTEPLGKVGCQEWVGGVRRHYYRKAA